MAAPTPTPYPPQCSSTGGQAAGKPRVTNTWLVCPTHTSILSAPSSAEVKLLDQVLEAMNPALNLAGGPVRCTGKNN